MPLIWISNRLGRRCRPFSPRIRNAGHRDDVSYRHDRFTYPLFEKYDNLYVEMSRWFGSGALEAVVSRFGARPISSDEHAAFHRTAVVSCSPTRYFP